MTLTTPADWLKLTPAEREIITFKMHLTELHNELTGTLKSRPPFESLDGLIGSCVRAGATHAQLCRALTTPEKPQDASSDDFRPDWASPPFDSIFERLQTLQISLNEFRQRLGLSDTQLVELIRGDLALTDEMASMLTGMLGPLSDAKFWANRERQYREDRARIERDNDELDDFVRELSNDYCVPHVGRLNGEILRAVRELTRRNP